MKNNNKYSTEEGLKELTRSLLMMKYDNSKTLSEQRNELSPNDPFANPSTAEKYLQSQRDMVKDVGRLIKKAGKYVWGCSKGLADSWGGDSTKVSECLTELRDAMWTEAGMVTTAMIEILGAEVGAPIIVKSLNYLFLINDSTNTIKNWKSSDNIWSDNPNLLRTVEDMLFIALDIFGPALIKGALRTPAGLIAYIMEYTGKKTEKEALIFLAQKVRAMFSKVGNVGIFKEWFENNKREFDKLINLIDGDVKIGKSVSDKLGKSIIGGAKTLGTLKGLNYLIEKLKSSDSEMSPTAYYMVGKPVVLAMSNKTILFKDYDGNCYQKKGNKYYNDYSCKGDKEALNRIEDQNTLETLFSILVNYLTLNPEVVDKYITSYKVFIDTKGQFSTHLNSTIMEIDGYNFVLLCPTQQIVNSNYGKQYCKPYFIDSTGITSRFAASPTNNLTGDEKYPKPTQTTQTDNTKTQLNPTQTSATQKMKENEEFYKKLSSVALSKGWGPVNNQILKNLYDNGYLYPESPKKNKLTPEQQKNAQEQNKKQNTINQLLFNK